MRAVLAGLFALLAAAVLAPSAGAQAPGYGNLQGTPRVAGGPPAGSPTTFGGDVKPQDLRVGEVRGAPSTRPAQPRRPGGRLTKSCRRAGGKRTCRFRRGGRLVKVCVTTRRKRTCRTIANGRTVRICTKRRGKRVRCRTPRAVAGALQPGRLASLRGLDRTGARAAAGRYNGGFTNPLMAPVVRFYYSGATTPTKGWCSGTLLLRGVVLTAAHCLFANRTDGNGQYGYYPVNQLSVVPGNTFSGGRDIGQWGTWRVANAFVPQGWTAEDGGLDWGIAVIAPDAYGRYPGDFTGTFSATWSARFPFGSRIFRAGYPASGPFATAQWYYGGGQYFCDNRWDGETMTDFPYIASSYNIVTQPCEMNGGSSGGPVFVQLPGGSWTIVGVNNRGQYRDDGFGANGVSSYFDERFGQFWTSVMAQLQ